MEEVLFRMSHQLEALQVHASITAQQGQQLISAWLVQLQEFLQELYHSTVVQEATHNAKQILLSTQHSFQQLLRQKYFVYGAEVSKKEAMFCLGGMIVGGLIGFYAANRKGPWYIPRMKAIICYRYLGPKGVLMVDNVEKPTAVKPYEVLIHVKAASLNIVDMKISKGYSKWYRRLFNSGKDRYLPVTLGRECAGVVSHIGRSVKNFNVGDSVFLAVPSWAPGTMAEYIVVPENRVMKVPKLFSYEEAATFPYSGCLAWDALVNRSGIEGSAKGKRVLICSAHSPVGCLLIQLVNLWDGYVVVVCNKNAVSYLLPLGAKEAIVAEGWELDKELILQEKFDIVFCTQTNDPSEDALRKYMTSNGSYVSTAPREFTSSYFNIICNSIFTVCAYLPILLAWHVFGFDLYQWDDGCRLKMSYLEAVWEIADASEVLAVMNGIYEPESIAHALHRVQAPDAVGSTVITFQRSERNYD